MGFTKKRLFILAAILTISVVCVSTCRTAGTFLVENDRLVHADAIVILMGSIGDRVLQAVDLYDQRWSGRIIIVEENMEAHKAMEARGISIISNSEQARAALISLGLPFERINILPGNARSTQDEAVTIWKFLAGNPGIDTLIVISSSYHTRRASMIFRSVSKKATPKVYFVCNPSSYTDFRPEKWWRRKEDIQTVLLEYLKIANFIIYDKGKLKKTFTYLN